MKRQAVVRGGVELINFVMEKKLAANNQIQPIGGKDAASG
jgi:hypothetical protein